MASRCPGSRALLLLINSKQASLWTPSVSNSGPLIQRKLIHTSPCMRVTRGPVAAPPQRFISGTGHIMNYLLICAIMLSYPTYLFLNMDNVRTLVPKNLSEEVQEQIARRKELRAQGAMPVLQTGDK